MLDADLRLTDEGDLRLEVSSELQLTDRFSFDWSANTDEEYRVQFEYELTKQVVVTGGYDDLFEWGAGVELRY